MSDDLELAALLGEAPPETPDPGFRYDVFARITVNGRRRAARRKALTIAGGFTLLGVALAAAQGAGLSFDRDAAMLAAGALVLAFAAAAFSIGGPSALLRPHAVLARF